MATKKRFEISVKQIKKRRKNRKLLKKKGLDPDDFYYGKFYIGPDKKVSG